jgi:hypothetical protein
MVKVFKPTGKDTVSNRKISQTADDRKQQLKEFREDKEHKQKLKEERFAKIAEKRKRRPPTGGGGGGINVKVGGEE